MCFQSFRAITKNDFENTRELILNFTRPHTITCTKQLLEPLPVKEYSGITAFKKFIVSKQQGYRNTSKSRRILNEFHWNQKETKSESLNHQGRIVWKKNSSLKKYRREHYLSISLIFTPNVELD